MTSTRITPATPPAVAGAAGVALFQTTGAARTAVERAVAAWGVCPYVELLPPMGAGDRDEVGTPFVPVVCPLTLAPAFDLRSRRRVSSGVVKGTDYRLTNDNPGARGGGSRRECGFPMIFTARRAHPPITVHPQSPVANIRATSPCAEITPMPQRLPEMERITEFAYLVRKDAIAAASCPDSEWNEDTSPAEWERIQRAEQLATWLTRMSAGVEHAIRVLHNGLDAPSVQRGGRDLFGRDHDRDDEYEGMRR